MHAFTKQNCVRLFRPGLRVLAELGARQRRLSRPGSERAPYEIVERAAIVIAAVYHFAAPQCPGPVDAPASALRDAGPGPRGKVEDPQRPGLVSGVEARQQQTIIIRSQVQWFIRTW